MIKKDKKFTLKTTLVYPALVVLSFLVILLAKLTYEVENQWYVSLLDSCAEAVNIVKLEISNSLVIKLIENNIFLLIDYIGLLVVSIISLASFTFVLFKSTISNLLKFKYFEKEITYIFGLSDDAKTYIKNLGFDIIKDSNKSTTRKNQVIVILKKTNLTKYSQEKIFLDEQHIKYKICELDEQQHFFKTISTLTKHIDKKKYNCISFYEDDKDIYDFIKWTQNYLKNKNLYKNENIQFIVSTDYKQKFFVNELIIGSPSDTDKNSIGKEVTIKDESRGKIRLFNKYDMISYDFLWKNNLAKYFPKDLIADDCTINDKTSINLFVLGYGKVNQSMLRDILIETQFIRKTYDSSKGTYEISPVRMNVHIYDENKKMLNWEFNNGFMKYNKNNYNQSSNNYYDLSEDYISHIKTYFEKNTNEKNFISSLYDNIKAQAEVMDNVVNYFLISLGSDFDNSFIAQQICESLINVKNIHNTLFIRTRDGMTLPNRGKNGIVYFGNDKSILSYDNVVADKVYLAAKIESCKYMQLKPTKENISFEWTNLSKIKQKSNLYSVASIPFKLSLLKLNLSGLTEDDYKKKLEVDERKSNCVMTMKKIIEGTTEFHPIDILAISEHERWNAYEISQGSLPMKKSLFHSLGETKNENELYHANICSQKGLLEYYDEGNEDVIQYDYDLMQGLMTHLQYLDIKNEDISK